MLGIVAIHIACLCGFVILAGFHLRPFESLGDRLESRVPRAKSASVAQLAEQRFCKPQVVGSSPSAGSIYDLE